MLAVREVILRNVYPLLRSHYGLVVDIGAHIGTFAARICTKADRVVAFEPTVRNFSMLDSYLRTPLNNVERHKLAVTGDGRNVRINIHPNNTGQHSIFQHSVPALRVEEVASISSANLLTFLKADEIDLLKIDVEGSEHEICSAAPNLLLKTREIIIEANATDVDHTPGFIAALLQTAGFKLSLVMGNHQQSVFHGIR